MNHADMACAVCFCIAVATAMLSCLHVWMGTQDKRRVADKPVRHARDVTSSTMERSTQTSWPQAWRPSRNDGDEPEEPPSRVEQGGLASTCSPTSTGARAHHDATSSQHHSLLTSSNRSGLCACGRRTCARKTHDSTLVEAKQRVIRGKHPRHAKMQSALVPPEFFNCV